MARATLDDSQTEIENFKAEVYYPNIKPNKQVQEFLNEIGDIKYLKSLAPLQLAEYSVMLAHYSVYLTTVENRLKSYIGYCSGNIKHICSKNLDKTPFTWYAEKVDYITANEPNAAELDKERASAQAKLDMIVFLSQKISYLAETIKDLRFAKQKEYKGD